MVKPVSIGARKLGAGEQIFIIAEIGINHNQDLEMAKKLIDAAANAGCDAAKFQTFTAKALYVDRSFAGTYRLMGKNIPIYDLHVGLEMPHSWIPILQEHCDKWGITFFSTPVDRTSVDALDQCGVQVFKISSYDMTNIPLLQYVSTKGKPVIFSTGGATLGEVDETVQTLNEKNTPFAIMHCIAKYPAPFRYANLAVMDTLRSAFGVPTGFSDNGFSDDTGRIDAGRVPVAASRAGADLFEIHITLDRKLPGADHGFATTPDELKTMVKEMRVARDVYNKGIRTMIEPELWGSSIKQTYDAEKYVREFAYKCLFAIQDIKAGDKLTADNVGVLRPGEHKRGIEPKYFDLLLQKGHAARAIAQWQPVTWDSVLS